MKKVIFVISIMLFASYGFAQDAESVFKQAEAKYQNGDYEGAIADYTKAISIDPEYLNAYLRRGFCHNLQKNYEAAIEDYSKILEKDPNHIWSYISRGSAYNKLKKYNKAMIDFDSVLRLDPKNQEAYNNRGWSKKFLGDQKGACADWKKSKKLGNAEAKIILKNNHCK